MCLLSQAMQLSKRNTEVLALLGADLFCYSQNNWLETRTAHQVHATRKSLFLSAWFPSCSRGSVSYGLLSVSQPQLQRNFKKTSFAFHLNRFLALQFCVARFRWGGKIGAIAFHGKALLTVSQKLFSVSLLFGWNFFECILKSRTIRIALNFTQSMISARNAMYLMSGVECLAL